jgi:hypothetical protein
MSRVEWGFAVAAFGLPALVVAIGGFEGLGLAGMVAAVTTLATGLFGTSVYAWCLKRRSFSAYPFIASGAAAGFVLSLSIMAFAPSWKLLFRLIVPFGGLGIIHGLLFWLVAIYRNHDLPGVAAASNHVLGSER